MRTLKKVLSIVMALALILSVSVSAFAEATITYEADADDSNYKAYQLFKGTFEEGVLVGIEWGDSVTDNGAAIIDMLVELGLMEQPAEDAEAPTPGAVAEALAAANDNAELLAKMSQKLYDIYNAAAAYATIAPNTTEKLADGWYLLIEDGAGKDGIVNQALMQFAGGDVKIVSKVDKPSLDKKVEDLDDSKGNEAGWSANDSADHDINDRVKFELDGKMPGNIEGYETYWMIFHDQSSDGLTTDFDSFVVKVGDQVVDPKHYTVQHPAADGHTFDVIFNDVLSLTDTEGNDIVVEANTHILVDYVAVLNENAVIGNPGNPNTASLEYDNNPNVNGEPGNGSKTEEDTVVVFTYDADIDKVDQDDHPLKGAGFTLFKKVPAVPEKEGDPDFKWVKIGDEVKGEDLTSFYFKGLDAGEYKLEETTVPGGYNKAADVEFEIVAANHSEEGTGDLEVKGDLSVKGGGSKNNGADDQAVAQGKVVNNRGVVLPSTGGIGTTIFYVVGSLLVAGAAILLVTKRRAGAAE